MAELNLQDLLMPDAKALASVAVSLPMVVKNKATLAKVHSNGLGPEICEEMKKLLDMPLGNRLIEMWHRHKAIEAARKLTATGDPARKCVRILDETARISRHFTVAIADPAGVESVVLELDLKLVMHAPTLRLVIEKGEIAGFDPAEVEFSAALEPLGLEKTIKLQLLGSSTAERGITTSI